MLVIMPVKDSLDTARESIAALTQALSAHHSSLITHRSSLIVYNDFSTPENTAELERMSSEMGFELVNWADRTNHPSPNYRLTLQDAQQRALEHDEHLVIVESDVVVRPDTLQRLESVVNVSGDQLNTKHLTQNTKIGMVAAVTVDTNGNINFPYLYAQKMKGDIVDTHKRFSFCCTLLSNEFLKAFSFMQLDPEKSWYDVFISHQSVALGFHNLLMLDNPVLHKPHSSRPWKKLKYTNPIKYYWQKITRKRDRI